MKRILLWGLCLCLLLTACAAPADTPSDGEELPSQSQQDVNDTNDANDSDATDTAVADGEYFTDRDLRATYEDAREVELTGGTVTIDSAGTYLLTGSMEGQVVVDAGKQDKLQLVLRDVSIHSDSSAALYIRQADKVVVTLEGENSLSSGESLVAVDENNIDGAVFSKDDLTFNGAGSLTVTSPGGHGIVCKDDLVFTGGAITIECAEHGVDANDSLRCRETALTVRAGKDGLHVETDEGTGFIYLESGTLDIVSQGDGISAADTLTVLGGTYTVTSGGGSENAAEKTSDGWGMFGGGFGGGMGGRPGGYGGAGGVSMNTVGTSDSSEDSTSAKGLKAGNTVTVKGGSFRLDTADDAVHANGSIAVEGGEFTVAAGDDGFHADDTLTVSGGTVDITESYEGLEALHVTVSGGEIRIVSSDDGINAAGGTDSSGTGGLRGGDQFGGPGGFGGMSGNSDGSITITGGDIYMNASGDGIDANGTLEMSGGYVVVCGPTQGDTAVLDYDVSAKITGGTFIGTGSTMMAQSFGEESTQGVFAVTIGTQAAGTNILLQSANGDTVVDYTPQLSFGLVILSTPDIVRGQEYTITVGSATGTFEAN